MIEDVSRVCWLLVSETKTRLWCLEMFNVVVLRLEQMYHPFSFFTRSEKDLLAQIGSTCKFSFI